MFKNTDCSLRAHITICIKFGTTNIPQTMDEKQDNMYKNEVLTNLATQCDLYSLFLHLDS